MNASVTARHGVLMLGITLALPHLAAAQSPACDRYDSTIDRSRCREAQQRNRPPPLQAPPQAEPVAPAPPVDPRVRDVLERLRALGGIR